MRLRNWFFLTCLSIAGDCARVPEQTAFTIGQSMIVRRTMTAPDKLALLGYLASAEIQEARLFTFADGRSPVVYVRRKNTAVWDQFTFPEVDHQHQALPVTLFVRH